VITGAAEFLDEEAKAAEAAARGSYPKSPAPKGDELGEWDAGEDDAPIPPRGWLLGNSLCRRFLSSLIGDGGVGKTALRIAQLLSLATGRALTGEHVFRRCRVLLVSLEDDRDELRRRVRAAMLHHGIKLADVKGWLYLAAPKGLRLVEKLSTGAEQIGSLEHLLRATITKYGIDAISLDPFVKTHGLEENDNNAIDRVCGVLAKLAIELDCATDAPHHVNKGQGAPAPGDANRGPRCRKTSATCSVSAKRRLVIWSGSTAQRSTSRRRPPPRDGSGSLACRSPMPATNILTATRFKLSSRGPRRTCGRRSPSRLRTRSSIRSKRGTRKDSVIRMRSKPGPTERRGVWSRRGCQT
jgi:hypothetical protein